jgi:hypothetical protein
MSISLRRFFALLLMCAAIGTLAGCGGDDPVGVPGPAPAPDDAAEHPGE